jgi:hypothetical protein
MLRRATILAGLCAVATPATAVEILAQRLEVGFSYAGYDERYDDPLVPLLPANACYTWHVQLAAPDAGTPAPATLVERLVLPVPLADWGTVATTPDDNVEISADGTTAITSFAAAPDAEGWLSNGWCVAAGDPVGPHRFELELDGAPLTSFDFEVVAPEDYNWPSIPQPDPTARTVYNSW